MNLGVHFGALAEPIAEQLEEQGVVLPPEAVERIQQDADAIVRLRIRDLLPRTQADAAFRRLMKSIRKAIEAAPAAQEEE